METYDAYDGIVLVSRGGKKKLLTAGLEPAIFALGGRRLIHSWPALDLVLGGHASFRNISGAPFSEWNTLLRVEHPFKIWNTLLEVEHPFGFGCPGTFLGWPFRFRTRNLSESSEKKSSVRLRSLSRHKE